MRSTPSMENGCGTRTAAGLLVFGREAGNLRRIAASGGYGFLADLLDIAGSENVFGDIKQAVGAGQHRR